MSADGFEQVSVHEIAHAEVEAWRGECLSICAKGQALIGRLLELARASGKRVRLLDKAQHRTVEAMRLADLMTGETQAEDADAVLSQWQSLESRCELLASGVATETVDRSGNWFAMFDLASYRSGRVVRGRWTVSREEAESFLQELDHSFTMLNQQLGCMCQELGGGFDSGSKKPRKTQAL